MIEFYQNVKYCKGMKKYSTEYFEKKYKILSDKLIQKEGFINEIKAARKELGLPVEGFTDAPELAVFLVGKMSKSEQEMLTYFAFLEAYAYENKISITDENREEVHKAFLKKGYKKGIGMIPMVFWLSQQLMTHHSMFTAQPISKKNKYLSSLYPVVKKLMQKFWGITEEMYDSFLREYKGKQAELLEQMQDHSDADEEFYLTANMTLNIAKRAKEIFVSSEVEEKNQFLGFLLQNCALHEKKLEFSMRSPFNLMLNMTDNPTVRRR